MPRVERNESEWKFLLAYLKLHQKQVLGILIDINFYWELNQRLYQDGGRMASLERFIGNVPYV